MSNLDREFLFFLQYLYIQYYIQYISPPPLRMVPEGIKGINSSLPGSGLRDLWRFLLNIPVNRRLKSRIGVAAGTSESAHGIRHAGGTPKSCLSHQGRARTGARAGGKAMNALPMSSPTPPPPAPYSTNDTDMTSLSLSFSFLLAHKTSYFQ